MFQGLGNLASLFKQAQQLGSRIQEIQADLRKRRTTGTSGGGMVEVEANGVQEIVRCQIDPSLFAQGDKELVEDLVCAAVNQALEKSRALQVEAMQQAAGGMELPGLSEALTRLTGGNTDTK